MGKKVKQLVFCRMCNFYIEQMFRRPEGCNHPSNKTSKVVSRNYYMEKMKQEKRVKESLEKLHEFFESKKWFKYPENKPDPKKVKTEDRKVLVKVRYDSNTITYVTVRYEELNELLGIVIAWQYINPYIEDDNG